MKHSPELREQTHTRCPERGALLERVARHSVTIEQCPEKPTGCGLPSRSC